MTSDQSLTWKLSYNIISKDKLEKCGWTLSDHDMETCNCISLNLGLFKFIKNVPVSCRKICESSTELICYRLNDDIRFCTSESRLCYVVGDSRCITVNDLNQNKSETIMSDSMHLEMSGAQLKPGL